MLPPAQYTDLSSVVALTDAPATGVALPATDPSQYGNRPQACLLQAEDQDIRWTNTGGDPSASFGMILAAGESFLYTQPQLNLLRFIEATAGAKLNVTYYATVQEAVAEYVTSFNSRTGAVTLTQSDVDTALGYDAVQSVVAGAGVGVDATDPRNPIVSASAAGIVVWDDITTFAAGALVIDRGGTWQATGTNTNSRPSGTNADWILIGWFACSNFFYDSSSITEVNIESISAVIGGTFYEFTPSSIASLTSMSFPVLTTVGYDFSPNTMGSLTSMSFPVLTTVGDNFSPNAMGSLTSMSFPALTTVGYDFSPYDMASLTSMSFPVLTTVGDNFSPSTMGSLTSMSVPMLMTVGGGFSPYDMASLTSMSFPALTTVGSDFSAATMASLTSMSFPALEVIGGSVSIPALSDMDAVTTFTLPALLAVGGDITLAGTGLNQASVDALLVRFAALDGTGGTTSYDNHTIDMSGGCAIPSATGLAAKATLEGRGNTVTVNS